MTQDEHMALTRRLCAYLSAEHADRLLAWAGTHEPDADCDDKAAGDGPVWALIYLWHNQLRECLGLGHSERHRLVMSLPGAWIPLDEWRLSWV